MAQQQCTPVNRNYGINWCEFYGPRYVAREAEPHVTYGMGFSRVYDRAGFAQLNSFDQVGAAGSTTIQHACCIFGVSSAEDLPRITGIHNIAEMNINGVQFLFPPPPPTWPQIPAVNAQANLGGIDNTMKTPHAYTADFSIQRELPQRFSIQLAYVGRFSLIESRKAVCTGNNGGQPTNYCQAIITPAQIQSVTASMRGPTAQYWVDRIQPLRPGATHYSDTFGTGIVTSSNPTDSLIHEVFNMYYNPALSVA